MVKKKDGSNRVYVDFRKLNKITKVDPELQTTAEDLFQLSCKQYLSKIDLTKGYWQIGYLWYQKTCKKMLSSPHMDSTNYHGPFGMVNSVATQESSRGIVWSQWLY